MSTSLSPSTTMNSSSGPGGLFRTRDGRNLIVPFALIASLFLLWGFCNGMIDVLNKHFQDTLRINKEQSGLVQAANYLAYFLMAIPSGWLANRFGYKKGILVGLSLIATGSFWFIAAGNIGTYWAFLAGLFVIAAGMTCLETIANPYATVLGSPESGPTRINIAQATNGLGWVLGPIVGGYFVFSVANGKNVNAGLTTPYVGIGVFVALLLVVFHLSSLPDPPPEGETSTATPRSSRIRPTGPHPASLAIVLAGVCGLLYFFIAPILQLLWTLLHGSTAALPFMDGALLVVAYVTGYAVVRRHWSLFQRRHFTLGVAAQFFYVAAQAGIFSFFVNYVLENAPGVTRLQASRWLGAIGFVLFMTGRICGSAVVSQFKPDRVLAAYSVVNVFLVAAAMGGGKWGMYAMFASFFFMSVGFPTIFALAIRGLGEQTKFGSSVVVMSIVGGAIAPPFMGHIADRYSMRVGFVVPLICFACVALYGFAWRRLADQEPGSGL
jgi:MFS transporter, FHS family, L-fucose permease